MYVPFSMTSKRLRVDGPLLAVRHLSQLQGQILLPIVAAYTYSHIPTGKHHAPQTPESSQRNDDDSETCRAIDLTVLGLSYLRLPLHQPIHQQHPQLTQLMNRQRHIALLPRQIFRQVQ